MRQFLLVFDALLSISTVVLVGDAGVGKTNMLANFTGTKSGDVCNESGCADTFHPMRKPTIGVEFGTRIVTHTSGIKIKAQIWDTGKISLELARIILCSTGCNLWFDLLS